MSHKDHPKQAGRSAGEQDGNNESGSAGFNPDDLEFAPFMFDPSGQGSANGLPAGEVEASQPSGQFMDSEIEFEPFMFDTGGLAPGESSGMGPFGAIAVSTAPIPAPAPDAPPDPAPETPASPFAVTGHDVPAPPYLRSLAAETPSQSSSPLPSGPLASGPLPSGPLASGPLSARMMSSGPLSSGPLGQPPAHLTPEPQPGPAMSQESETTPKLGTGPLPTPGAGPGQSRLSSLMRGSGLLGQRTATGTEPLAAPTPADQTGPISGEGLASTGSTPQPTGMPGVGMGRARGNTGPLAADRLGGQTNASWSDSSLASIEDFSSILIAVKAGKRLRQSGPLSESMIPQQSEAATATTTSPPEGSAGAQPQTEEPAQADTQTQAQTVPDWAAQAVAGLATAPEMEVTTTPPSFAAPPSAGTPTVEEQLDTPGFGPGPVPSTPSWATGQWGPGLETLPEAAPEGGVEMEQPGGPVAAAPPAYPTSSWMAEGVANVADVADLQGVTPAEAAAQEVEVAPEPEPAPAPASRLPEMVLPPLTDLPGTNRSTVESRSLSDAARAELVAVRGSEVDSALGGLEPGVAELLHSVDEPSFHVVTEGGIRGEDLQFENFMFDQGTPSPLPSLPVLSAPGMDDAAAGLDMGPVFDPSIYNVSSESAGESDSPNEPAMHATPVSGPHSTALPDPAVPSVSIPPLEQEAEAVEMPEDESTELAPSDMSSFFGFVGGFAPAEPEDMEEEGATATPESPVTPAAPDAGSPMAGIAGMLGMLGDSDAAGSSSLPFWLRETVAGSGSFTQPAAVPAAPTGQPTYEAAAPHLNGAAHMPEMNLPGIEGVTREVAAPPALPAQPEEAKDDLDFADLPPIEPFDFSLMVNEEPEESLGFNTDELSGYAPAGRDSLVVTTDLEALADLLGGKHPTIPGLAGHAPKYVEEHPDPAHVEAPTEPLAQAQPHAAAQAQAEPEVQAQLQPEAAATEPAEETQEPGGWMATVTSNLTPEALTGALATSQQAEAVAPESAFVEDLGVDPFDFTGLDVGNEDVATGHLEAGSIPRKLLTANLQERTDAMQPRTAPKLEEVWSEADGDTSLFVTGSSELDTPVETDGEMPTGMLREETAYAQPAQEEAPVEQAAHPEQHETHHGHHGRRHGHDKKEVEAAAPSHEQPAAEEHHEEEGGVFKARVARAGWSSARVEAPRAEPQPEPQPQPAVEAPAASPWQGLASAALSQQEPAQNEHEVRFEAEPIHMPRRGDITSSGPLPSLDGFDDLNDWVEKYPHDMGAHFALASAYTQAGEFDTALRVYRRMLRKTEVSPTVLRMIEGELDEIAGDASHLPRYHQTRGDLLIKQGRHMEAIEEFNKLG